ncbi:hypothetical protein KEF29_03400 [Streptomyces tuirus]|uniref:Uncharacterized protein n=1 Tax=Streptomyces tuirus TaxID=68278 RepID=A0A941F7X7_9ACTN|nr:hypothetical protein [Streptomyces tuirus]
MTTDQLALDGDPSWVDDWEPSDRTPTRVDLRQAEMRDLRDQGPGPVALWTASDIPTGSYL